MTPRLIVHGAVDSAPTAEVLRGLEEAGAAGYDVLERGGHGIDAVEAAVRVLEEDPQFNAGLGSVLNEDGDVEIDTGIVDGTTGRFAGVAALTGVRFPISVAAELLRRSPGLVLLAGPRARRFATQMGLTMEDLRTPEQLASREHARGGDQTTCSPFTGRRRRLDRLRGGHLRARELRGALLGAGGGRDRAHPRLRRRALR